MLRLGLVLTLLAAQAGGPVWVVGGLAGGLYASRFVETMLFEVAPLDLSSLGLPLATLLLTALIAAAVPAWRAARVDPIIVLRNT